ncbi:helix-turn-helix transcriptional regulator [Ruminococcaceae bacterium OttesenSCG-928-A16]|nr:helix-turn-helix transcriptional regulator [Ruminococcaceae bacterium OttesenSCG-928-A16]
MWHQATAVAQKKQWTQEQLAEKLYVSRAAVSKWESGKGYPNIESLKSISTLFSVSVDNLLSGEEVILIAEDESRFNTSKILNLAFAVLDLITLAFLFLPLYSWQDNDMIRTVSLFANPDVNTVTWAIYLVLPVLMALLGWRLLCYIMQRLSSCVCKAIKDSKLLQCTNKKPLLGNCQTGAF